MSENVRLLCPRISQPSIARNSSQSSMVNQIGSQYNSVLSLHSLPGFSQSYRPELRNEPVYSQSNMPRMESNPMLSHMPLPSMNFSNGSFLSYQQAPGYFPPYSSLLHPTSSYLAQIQPNVTSSMQFPPVAQGSYSMPPPGPQVYGHSYIPVAPTNVAPPRQPAPGRIDFSVPGHPLDILAFERSSLTKEKRTTELFVKWHITFKGDRKRDPEDLRNV